MFPSGTVEWLGALEPFGLSLVVASQAFDMPVLSYVEGLRANGLYLSTSAILAIRRLPPAGRQAKLPAHLEKPLCSRSSSEQICERQLWEPEFDPVYDRLGSGAETRPSASNYSNSRTRAMTPLGLTSAPSGAATGPPSSSCWESATGAPTTCVTPTPLRC